MPLVTNVVMAISMLHEHLLGNSTTLQTQLRSHFFKWSLLEVRVNCSGDILVLHDNVRCADCSVNMKAIMLARGGELLYLKKTTFVVQPIGLL